LRHWAEKRGMQPIPALYVRATREGDCYLRFTAEKFAGLEDQFHIHYVSPQISERKRQNAAARAARPLERVVYWNLRDTACSECGAELPSGSFLFLDAGEPLCLACANLGEPEFLPGGDTALTRRAAKYSDLRLVVVRFSPSRKCYERQGILVPEAALRRAEESAPAMRPNAPPSGSALPWTLSRSGGPPNCRPHGGAGERPRRAFRRRPPPRPRGGDPRRRRLSPAQPHRLR
jgi:hypothetical protein